LLHVEAGAGGRLNVIDRNPDIQEWAGYMLERLVKGEFFGGVHEKSLQSAL